MRKIATPSETFDEPWKQIVPALFEPFVAFFAPDAYADIDWQRPPEFLDKELRRVAKGLSKRRVTADFLVKVWRKQGDELWLLAHIELQAQRDETFAQRMFRYNVRSYDLHQRPVYSLAILADDEASWRPSHFGYATWGCRLALKYPVVKLADYASRQAELEASDNPFALAVLAHLKTQETRGDAEARLAWKLSLARLLYARDWTRVRLEELLSFIDWIMSLPEAYEDRFEEGYRELERRKSMAETMSPLRRRAHDRALLEGRRGLLLDLIEEKFGLLPGGTAARLEAMTADELDRLGRLILTAQTLAELGL
jgi:hypothetical protein